MKRKTLITSIVLILVGFVTARVGDSLSTVAANGVVQDSILMPIGAILFILGILILIATVLWYLFSFVKAQLQKS